MVAVGTAASHDLKCVGVGEAAKAWRAVSMSVARRRGLEAMSENQGYPSVAVALPIADRRRSYDFYTLALGLEPVGTAGSDGVPEPLMLKVNDGLRLVLVPTGGFGSVIGEHEVAGEKVAECLMRIEQGSQTAVRALVDGARASGARVVAEPGQRPWGFEGTFADPDGHLWVVAEAGG